MSEPLFHLWSKDPNSWLSLCGKSIGPGERFVTFRDAGRVTCEKCKALMEKGE